MLEEPRKIYLLYRNLLLSPCSSCICKSVTVRTLSIIRAVSCGLSLCGGMRGKIGEKEKKRERKVEEKGGNMFPPVEGDEWGRISHSFLPHWLSPSCMNLVIYNC